MSDELSYSDLLTYASALAFPSRPALIAIGGFGGSGKSTLAKRLQSDLDHAEVISGDDFSVAQQATRCDDWSSIDRARLVTQVLEPARRGGRVRYQQYDWPNDRLGVWRSIEDVQFLIVEGIGIIHPDTVELFDLTVWLNTPLEIAAEQGRRRDKDEYGVDHDDFWRDLWMPNDRDYFQRFRPDQMVDLIIEPTDSHLSEITVSSQSLESSVPAAVGGNRVTWEQLPLSVRSTIEEQCGSSVRSAESQEGGFSPGFASRVLLDNGSQLFIKAISAEPNPISLDNLRREGEITRALPATTPAPRLLWSNDDGTWVVLAFEDIDGTHPALPWIPNELTRVLQALSELAAAMTPAPIAAPMLVEDNAEVFRTWRDWMQTPPSVDLPAIDPWMTNNLSVLAELESLWETAASGETLLHCDLRADNILLTSDKVYFVDWPSARIGAAWCDLLFMLPSIGMYGVELEPIVESHDLFRDVEAWKADAVLSAVAGYFIGNAVMPPPPGLPTVRSFQLAQGKISLNWLRQRLESRAP